MVGTGAKWSGGYFSLSGMTLQLLKKVQKPKSFVKKIVFLKLLAKTIKNDLFTQVKRLKNQIELFSGQKEEVKMKKGCM